MVVPLGNLLNQENKFLNKKFLLEKAVKQFFKQVKLLVTNWKKKTPSIPEKSVKLNFKSVNLLKLSNYYLCYTCTDFVKFISRFGFTSRVLVRVLEFSRVSLILR